MGRKPIGDERKDTVTIRLPRWVIEKLGQMGNIRAIIEKLIIDFVKREG